MREAEATNALIDRGADVITCHVDSPKVVVKTAAGRGAYICGYHANQSPLAPDKYLTGAEWNWAHVYTTFADELIGGKPLPNFVRGGISDQFIKMSPLGSAVTEPARKNFAATLAEASKGGFVVIKGPLKDNKGAVVATAGQAFPETAIELEKMNYLVDGVVGSTS